MSFLTRVGVATTTLAASSAAFGGLTFTFTSTGNASADAGFIAAGQLWSNIFSDNINIRINAGFTSLGVGILGSTGSNAAEFSYSQVRTALTGDSNSADDATAVASLPSGNALTFVTNARDGTYIIDSNGSTNNTTLAVNRANAKAIGLIAGNDTSNDASITFSSNFTFDFDRSDGITGGTYDFVGVAAHEIGHALGFVSGVDIVDAYSGPSGENQSIDLNGPSTGIGTLDPFAYFSVLDLFRYTTETQAQIPDRLDLGYAGTPYLSFDNGATSVALLSDGNFNGDDQRQASHWLDSMSLGIMDPTLSTGELALIRTVDIRALDAIGFDVIPEPATISIIAFGAIGALRRRRD